MGQIYNDNSKDCKKDMHFVRRFRRALGPGESTAGVTHLSMKISLKICHIFPLKVAATLLNGSRKAAVGS